MSTAAPSLQATAFSCPHCDAFAQQHWWSLGASQRPHPPGILEPSTDNLRIRIVARGLSGSFVKGAFVSQCTHCQGLAIWIRDQMIYPLRGGAPQPNADLPEDIRRDYDEAGSILDLSPRGAGGAAAACPREALQTCRGLQQEPQREYCRDGRRRPQSRCSKGIDSLRVIGNHAVHPGQIDALDERASAETMFRFLNIVAAKLISEPKSIEEAYEALPETARAAINKRDGNT